jgi:hypothetical protein
MPALEVENLPQTRLLTRGETVYLECLPESRVASERAALDLVAACGEGGTHRLLLHGASLPDDFFNLRSGLAGAVLLKFSNYYLKVALVLPPDPAHGGKFGEWMLETNRGSEFRVYPTREQAESWLVSGPA